MEISTNITNNTITTNPLNNNYYTNNTITIPTAPSFTSTGINLEDFILKYDRPEKRKEEEKKEDFTIYDVIEYVPQKVYEIKFADNTSVKTICSEYDEFDLEYMFYLAIAKKLYSKTLTFDGVLAKSYEIQYEKKFNKIVKNGVKILKQKQENKQKEEEEKAIKQRQKEKTIRKKKAAKERRKQDKISLIAEAIRLSKEGV